MNYGLLQTVLALAMFIQVHFLLHQKQERNYYSLYLVTFFLIASRPANRCPNEFILPTIVSESCECYLRAPTPANLL